MGLTPARHHPPVLSDLRLHVTPASTPPSTPAPADVTVICAQQHLFLTCLAVVSINITGHIHSFFSHSFLPGVAPHTVGVKMSTSAIKSKAGQKRTKSNTRMLTCEKGMMMMMMIRLTHRDTMAPDDTQTQRAR